MYKEAVTGWIIAALIAYLVTAAVTQRRDERLRQEMAALFRSMMRQNEVLE